MAIYLAKYTRKQGFCIPETIGSTWPEKNKLLWEFLKNYNKTLAVSDSQKYYYFYISVYDTNELSLRANVGTKDHGEFKQIIQMFAQYIFLKNDKWNYKYNLLNSLLKSYGVYNDDYISFDFKFIHKLIKKVENKIKFEEFEEDINSDILKDINENYNIFNSEPLQDLPKLPVIHLAASKSKGELKTFFNVGNLLETEGIQEQKYIMDSSIWNYYAYVDSSIFAPLQSTIERIIENSENGLYDVIVAHELADFKARQLLFNFLFNFHNNLDVQMPIAGGHPSVIPFVFHSEMKMKELAALSLKKINDMFSESLKVTWRILIVDDSASKTQKGKAKKCKVVANTLKADFCIKCLMGEEKCPSRVQGESNSPYQIIFDCALNAQSAVSKLKERRYDIILLDYLLDGDNNKYSTEILKLIQSVFGSDKIDEIPDEWKGSKGIFGKFWFMHISAFTNAISEKLHSEGMMYNTDYWHISRGACPTTTPELFKYNLLSLMYRQLQVLSVPLIEDKMINDTQRKIVTLIDFLKFIYSWPEKVRQNAIRNFNGLLRLRAYYDILKYDFYFKFSAENADKTLQNGSPLVQALFPDLANYSNSFWEHIQHLVYLTAYGTIRQWPEMWEEYMFVKPKLEQACKAIKGKEKTPVCKVIENFIIGLKDNC